MPGLGGQWAPALTQQPAPSVAWGSHQAVLLQRRATIHLPSGEMLPNSLHLSWGERKNPLGLALARVNQKLLLF